MSLLQTRLQQIRRLRGASAAVVKGASARNGAFVRKGAFARNATSAVKGAIARNATSAVKGAFARKGAFAALLAIALLLGGCAAGAGTPSGSGRAEGGEAAAAEAAKAAAAAEADGAGPDAAGWAGIEPLPAADAAEGLQLSRDAVKQLKQAAEAGDEAAWRELAVRLAGLWLTLEPDLKKLDEAKAEAAQADIGRLLQPDPAAPESPVDVSYRLYQTYRDLQEKLQGPAA